MKMDRKGFTLIELVIVIAIVGIVSLGIVNIVSYSMNIVSKETVNIDQQTDVRIVLVNFEKDLRRSNQEVTKVDDCVYVNSISYCLDNHSLTRDDIVLANNIEVFEVSVSTTFIDINVVSIADKEGNTSAADTRIYLR